MAGLIEVHLTGVNPSTVHLHLHSDNTEVIERLERMENIMSEMNDAIAAQGAEIQAMGLRISEDVDFLLAQNALKDALLTEALATDAADAAAIADLTARNDALNADISGAATRITENTSALAAIDPLADNPTPPVDPNG